jgi:YidC/Oxa1 family membrane protein insertase
VAPGAVTTQTTRLFAGAKTVPMLKDYEKTLGIPRFDDAVDWGMFWFFTKPIFMLLDFFFQHVGNFGVAILLLTVTVKLIFFPLANKSYESMSKMKKLSASRWRSFARSTRTTRPSSSRRSWPCMRARR